MTKRVYEEVSIGRAPFVQRRTHTVGLQRRKELALEAEIKRKEHEEIEAQARLDLERRSAKARAEKEAYDKVSNYRYLIA